ncbi:MAG: glycosyltransferase family 1 protein [Oscillospiraceae bacterium]|nr:glycosyltransferase family 1 protein [Oscillospiraceae bacterium]
MLRVLHIVTHMGRGGLETMIMNYYRNIDRNKIQFDFLVHRDYESAYDKEILSLGGRIFHVPVLNPFSPAYYRALDEFFSAHKYDIVHSHLDCLSAYPLRSAKKHGVKIRIAHGHSSSQDKNLKYPIKYVSRYAMPYFATHLFACGEKAGQWMFPRHNFTIMANALNTERFTYLPKKSKSIRENLGVDSKFVLGHVGRFNFPKNHPFLIDVFFSVQKLYPESVLLLIGDGDAEVAIRKKVNALGIQEKVLFMGELSDVSDMLQAMDVFVFPSLYEGLSLATVEAQAAGLPCIMSDQVPYECKMTENVEFLPLTASPETWSKHILKYLSYEKKNTYREICKAGFDINQNVKWLENFYLSEVEKREQM